MIESILRSFFLIWFQKIAEVFFLLQILGIVMLLRLLCLEYIYFSFEGMSNGNAFFELVFLVATCMIIFL